MNERIKLLADQAEVWSNQFEEHWGDGPDTYELFKEKFAELIVNDVLNIVAIGGEFCSRPKLFEQIKEHFGVEQ